MRKTILLPLIALGVLGPAVASADLIIGSPSIEIRSSTFTVQSDTTAAEAMAEFEAGTFICGGTLEEITNVGSWQPPCSGGSSNLATLIRLHILQDQDVMWQFDADWGRGGIVFGDLIDETVFVGNYNWAYQPDNEGVISFVTTGNGRGVLNILGFEDCCSENLSLRYSLDQGETWQVAKVPEPTTLALFGLGLAGLGMSRRKKG